MDTERSNPAAGTPAPVAPLNTPQVEQTGQGSVSPSQAETVTNWIKEDLAAGKMTAEQAERAFAELQTPEEQRTPDTRTPEQKQFDQIFPQCKPEDYRINYGEPGQAPPEMTPELQQADSAIRLWLSEAGVHRELGTSLTNAIGAVTRDTAGMSEAQLENYVFTEDEKLERMYKGTLELESKLLQAGEMIDALDKKQPGLKALLQSHGIGDNALVVSLLIQIAERFHWRKR